MRQDAGVGKGQRPQSRVHTDSRVSNGPAVFFAGRDTVAFANWSATGIISPAKRVNRSEKPGLLSCQAGERLFKLVEANAYPPFIAQERCADKGGIEAPLNLMEIDG